MLVGLPTLNHADSVGPALKAAHVAFNNHFARERTVLLNSDGGSTDGTTDLVRKAPLADGDTLLASHSLRTRHRISAPYHGVPGKAGAIRTIFAAADLLQARAVAVLDPEVVSVTADSLAALAAAGAGGRRRLRVAGLRPPSARRPSRHPGRAAAVPVDLRAQAAGAAGRASSPAAGASLPPASPRPTGRATRCGSGIDLWLSAIAAVGPVPRRRGAARDRATLAPRPRPGTASLVAQVFEALFSCLRLHEAAWTARARSEPVPVYGQPASRPPGRAVMIDVTRDAALFREGVAALEPMLSRALRPATLEALRAGAAAPGPAAEPSRRASGRPWSASSPSPTGTRR